MKHKDHKEEHYFQLLQINLFLILQIRLSGSSFQPKGVLARFWQFLALPGNTMRIPGCCLNQGLKPATKPEEYCEVCAWPCLQPCVCRYRGSYRQSYTQVFQFSVVLLLLQTLKNSKSSCDKISPIGKYIWIVGVSVLLSC